MPSFIALLRAINLAGQRRVAMADLRDLVAELGFDEPRTLLQSGNVVFEGGGRMAAQVIEQRLEAASTSRLGFAVEFFVRTTRDWTSVLAQNPFPDEAARDPGRLLVMFLRDAPPPAAMGALQAAIRGRERAQISGRHLYLVYPDGVGRARLTTALIEQKLRTRGTARNWNTVLKLAALCGA